MYVVGDGNVVVRNLPSGVETLESVADDGLGAAWVERAPADGGQRGWSRGQPGLDRAYRRVHVHLSARWRRSGRDPGCGTSGIAPPVSRATRERRQRWRRPERRKLVAAAQRRRAIRRLHLRRQQPGAGRHQRRRMTSSSTIACHTRRPASASRAPMHKRIGPPTGPPSTATDRSWRSCRGRPHWCHRYRRPIARFSRSKTRGPAIRCSCGMRSAGTTAMPLPRSDSVMMFAADVSTDGRIVAGAGHVVFNGHTITNRFFAIDRLTGELVRQGADSGSRQGPEIARSMDLSGGRPLPGVRTECGRPIRLVLRDRARRAARHAQPRSRRTCRYRLRALRQHLCRWPALLSRRAGPRPASVPC